MTYRTSLLALVAGAVLLVASCEGVTDPGTAEDLFTDLKAPVTIVDPGWARSAAISHTVAEILRDEGYEVTINDFATELAADPDFDQVAASFQALADGSADMFLAAWLPAYHGSFYGPSGQYTDQIVDYGANFQTAHRGLVVPSYSAIDSIADLDAASADYGATILGIDPDAKLSEITAEAITNDTYGLANWTLTEPADAAETFDAVSVAIAAGDDVVFTGWKPHWMFGKHELKLLADPENIYGDPQDIHTLGRQGLDTENPGVHTFLGEFGWTNLNFQEVMLAIQEDGKTPQQAARDYIEANRPDIEASLPPDSPYFQ